jgi:hypothetical protein
VGEISAKYQKYVDSGSLSREKAALWTTEDREKVEKRELARRLAAEPVTTQPKPPTPNPYPTSVQSSVPRSASTDPYDRVNIPARAPLASASVDIADTSSRSQPYTSDTAALLRKLSSQNLGTQPPLPRPDSAASVLSEIDKILHGEGKTSPAGLYPLAVVQTALPTNLKFFLSFDRRHIHRDKDRRCSFNRPGHCGCSSG